MCPQVCCIPCASIPWAELMHQHCCCCLTLAEQALAGPLGCFSDARARCSIQAACLLAFSLVALCRLTSCILADLKSRLLACLCRCIFRASDSAKQPSAASSSGSGLGHPAGEQSIKAPGRHSTELARPGSRLNPGNSPRRTVRQPQGAPDQPTTPEMAGASWGAAAQAVPSVDQQRLVASIAHGADATGAGGSGKAPPAAAPATSVDTEALDHASEAEAHPAAAPPNAEALGAGASGSSQLHSADVELSGAAGPTEERAESFFSNVFRLRSSSVVGMMSKTAVRQQVSPLMTAVNITMKSFRCLEGPPTSKGSAMLLPQARQQGTHAEVHTATVPWSAGHRGFPFFLSSPGKQQWHGMGTGTAAAESQHPSGSAVPTWSRVKVASCSDLQRILLHLPGSNTVDRSRICCLDLLPPLQAGSRGGF